MLMGLVGYHYGDVLIICKVPFFNFLSLSMIVIKSGVQSSKVQRMGNPK
jgi:hypothetical protein